MTNPYESLPITTLFDSPEGDEESNQNYRDITLRTLKKILPKNFFEIQENEEAFYRHQQGILKQVMPLITFSTSSRKFPGTISFFALSKYRPSSFKFFFEMISRWLAPGKRLNVVLVYASDFRLIYSSEEVYTICEVMISLESESEFDEIQRNFPIIGTEITLGMHSEFYAQRILEIKGLSADDKTALIQSFIASLVKRFPYAYDQDVFNEMQHVLVTCRDEFKAARQSRHLSRIISIQYLFRKSLREAIKNKSHRRYLNLKIFRALIKTQQGVKSVLGILVGINFLREQETFGQKHLMKAIQYYIPNAISIDDSFFIHKLGNENICIAYIEIEKKNGEQFTPSDIKKLRKELPSNLKNRVEQRLHHVFMPRNEEEVMRNILTLSNQIKYVRDIPQVLINFEEQAHSHLYFTVILARILKPGHCSIAELFQKSDTLIEYIPDRTKEMGFVRNKYVKEASVFRVKLSKEGFLRDDHSIDLLNARQIVVGELCKVVGEIRDYNGGMISKQNELLSLIREYLVIDGLDYDENLFENFFYSLAPVIARTLLDPKSFKTLFLMLLEGLREYKQEGFYLKSHSESSHFYVLSIVEDLAAKESIFEAIQKLEIPAVDLSSACVKTHGNMCIGFIYCESDIQKREHFFHTIESILNTTVVF
ncbi:MAG: hypothetical protein Q8K60_04515 [Parachlamydiaceae bacterium]|nr:hypothetical protein [Parachlamydiaceae bacterium]